MARIFSQTKTFISTESELTKLSEEEWNELYLRLWYFSVKHYSKAFFDKSQLKEFVHQSIVDYGEGKRNHPPNVPIFNLLCGIIRSNISHYFAKQGVRTQYKNKVESEFSTHNLFDSGKRIQNKIEASETVREIEIKISNDKELIMIHQAMLKDSEVKSNEISEDTDIPIDIVKNAKRRYFRLVRRLVVT
jgi:hypothetical protein